MGHGSVDGPWTWRDRCGMMSLIIQTMKAWIIGTISVEALCHVVGLNTCHHVYKSLNRELCSKMYDLL